MSDSERRGRRRHAIPDWAEATVECDAGEAASGRRTFRVLDVSIGGVRCDPLAEGCELAAGDVLENARLQLNGLTIRGEMVVAWVASEGICGALFLPESDGEMNKLAGLVAGLELADCAPAAATGSDSQFAEPIG